MVTRFFYSFVLVLAAFPVWAQSQADAQALTAFVDTNEITLNDIFTLTIRVDSTLGNARPSLGGLNRDFEQIGNINTRSSYTNVNGNVQSFVDYIVRLRPLSTGSLTIPSLRIGSEVTTPISISVDEASQVSPSGDNEIFIISEVSKERIYVQEQLLYTIKLYYSISFDQGAQLTSPQVADSVVQQLGSDETYSEIVDGIRYNVTERKFVIFPQSSGELTIPPIYFTATVGRRGGLTRFFNNRTSVREINLASDTHAIEVLSKPASFPGLTWLPAANLSIVESWSGTLESLGVGESITRNISITATGLSSSLLPGINYDELPGLKFYPDQPVREDSADEFGVTGSRTEGTAIVPSATGEFIIPEVVIYWWNTTTDRLEESVIPEQILSVLQGSSPGQNSMPDFSNLQTNNLPLPTDRAATPATQTSGLYLFWISSTAVFAVAWLFTTLMWLRNRRMLAFVTTATPAMLPGKQQDTKPQATPNADAALKILKTAIAQGDPGDIKRCIIAWGKALFQDNALMTLAPIARLFEDDEFDALILELEQSLYSGANVNSFDAQNLEKIVSRLHKKGRTTNKEKHDYSLPPLYKN